MMKEKRRGFTVVELVIVIAVVAILAAVLIPTYVNLVKKSNEANALAEAKNLISEMLTDIILGDKDSADLLVFSQKGDDVYLHGYSAEQQRFLSYKNNPIPLTTNMETTVREAVDRLLTEGIIKQNEEVKSDNPKDWRLKENVEKIIATLSTKYDVVVYANYIIDVNLFAPHVHNFGAWEHGDAENHIRRCSCGETETAKHEWESKTENNVKIYTCKVCYATKTEVGSGNEKHNLFYHAAKAATCTEAGNEEYWECVDKDCGKYFSDSKAKNEITDKNSVKIAAKGHTPVTDAAVAATCVTKGKTEGSHCSVCNAVIKAQESTEIDPNNHESIKWKHKICLKAPYFDTEKQIFIANESYSPMNYFFGIFDREFTYVQLDWECDACKRKNDSVLEGGIIFTDYKDSEGNPVEPGKLKCGEIYEVTIKCDSQIISESEDGDKGIPHCNSEWKVKIYIDHWHVNNAFDGSIGKECFYCHKTIESAPNTHIIGIETEGYLEDLTAGK